MERIEWGWGGGGGLFGRKETRKNPELMND